LFTAVKLSKEFKEASSQGFSILAGYIFGNKENENSHDFTSNNVSRDSMTVMFMVPKKSLIKKRFKAKRIADRISTRTSKTVAAITFGGWADDTKIEKYKEKLKTALDAEGITYTLTDFTLGTILLLRF
jgi:nitrogenase subunit NifH